MFTDGKIWCQTINYSLLACYRWKQNWKITSITDSMAFLAKALFQWNKSSKNADISILSNFLVIFFSISRNFTQYYLHAKFQINRTIQTEICPLPAIPICKKPTLYRVKTSLFARSSSKVLESLTNTTHVQIQQIKSTQSHNQWHLKTAKIIDFSWLLDHVKSVKMSGRIRLSGNPLVILNIAFTQIFPNFSFPSKQLYFSNMKLSMIMHSTACNCSS